MLKFFLSLATLIISCSLQSLAQDTLPRISVVSASNQVIVSWKNNYGAKISNINIQRSNDSLKNFTTIGSVLNPLSKENGFVDRNATNTNMFYRVFVAFEGGMYLFSPSHKPVIKSSQKQAVGISAEERVSGEDNTAKQNRRNVLDSLQKQAMEIIPKQSFDTSQNHLAHTPVKEPAPPVIVEKDLIPARKFPKPVIPSGFVASKYVYTNKDNNLILNLPDADKVNFSIRFYDDKGKQVFVIKKIKESYLIVDKVNFLRTGWFYYDLFDDDILLEKYKFYIGRDGRVGPPPPETNRGRKRTQN
jgi:hypothetical protein